MRFTMPRIYKLSTSFIFTAFTCFTQGEKLLAGMPWHSGSHTLERYLYSFPLSLGFLLKIVLKKKKIVLKAVARSRHWTWNLFTPDLIKYNWCINARVKVILKIATHCHWTQAMNDLIQVKQKYPDHFT